MDPVLVEVDSRQVAVIVAILTGAARHLHPGVRPAQEFADHGHSTSA
jgi:hypothetical protein